MDYSKCLWATAHALILGRFDIHERMRDMCGMMSPKPIAVFGVTNQIYMQRYHTVFASLACEESPDVDMFLLVDTGEALESAHDVDAAVHDWQISAPAGLRHSINYVPVDLSLNFTRNQFHTSWPEVAYWWVMGPELFYELGYRYAVYVDGDVFANSAFHSGGSFECSMIRSQLVPLLAADNDSRRRKEPAQERLVAGAVESPLGIMISALGGDEALLARHSALGFSMQHMLLSEHALTVNTGVLVFSCAESHTWRLLQGMLHLAQVCAELGITPIMGDMHLFGLLLMLVADAHDGHEPRSGHTRPHLHLVEIIEKAVLRQQQSSSLSSSSRDHTSRLLPESPLLKDFFRELPVSWNFRFNRNRAAVEVDHRTGELSFRYELGHSTDSTTGKVEPLLVHFTWAKPWLLDETDHDSDIIAADPDIWDLSRLEFARKWQELRDKLSSSDLSEQEEAGGVRAS